MGLLLCRKEQGAHGFGHQHHFSNHALGGQILIAARRLGNGAHDADHELRLGQLSTGHLMRHMHHRIGLGEGLVA